MMPGTPAKRTHDYVRHGTTGLGDPRWGYPCWGLPLEVHLVCDNYSTHKTPRIAKWLDAHPRFRLHLTPTCSSRINQVERFFALRHR